MSLDVLPPPGEFRTTEEIRDARYAEELRTKRRRLLLWSLPLMLIAFIAAVKLLSAVALNMAGSSAYENANHNTAADRFASLEFFNVIEPWKAHFNQGTAIYASGQFFRATQQLDVALDLVPKAPQGEPPGEDECSVRTNYSLALEGLGDEAMAEGDPAMGAARYAEAQEMLASCGESGGNGGEEAQEAEERQQESQEQAEEQQEQQEQEGEGEDPTDGPTDGESETPTDGESSGGETPTDGESSGGETPTDGESSGEGGESETPTESTDPQQEELESRNEEAQQSADAEEQASGGGDGSGQNW
ncbi:hypothetical protein [Pseudactinotalea suaedae]|uniref:hypothetical protein n=1 Tax=Pseudactinotalea suaedae TaxID=1524924 RepID=UPI0012E1A774|nr:hypothetical protein [Pseudactinotalea suaedae]